MRELLARFEHLGSDCEFCAVQRRLQVFSPALLNPGLKLEPLISALERGLVGVGDPQQVQISETPQRQYRIHELRYEIVQVREMALGALAPEVVLERECRRLRFLADKLLEDLASGEKIFVYKQGKRFSNAEIEPLFRALRAYGPNRLLCVGPAGDRHPAGSVEQLEEGLMCGYLGRFLDRNLGPDPLAHVIDGWTSLCRKAWNMQADRLVAA